MMTQQRFEHFLALHQASPPLLLANAWDAASARLCERLNAPAVATTSAGVAWARGYADGNALPRNELLSAVRGIARVLSVPLTVDIEEGYSADAREVADLVLELVAAGVVGINLEDGGGSPTVLVEKISAIRAALHDAPLYINARTDVYLRGLVAEDRRQEESIKRLRLYQAAGASGAFVPALVQETAISAILAQISLPLNLLAVPGLPDMSTLSRLGVSRISAGSGTFLAAYNAAQAYMRDFMAGVWPQLPVNVPDPLSYPQFNQFFTPPPVCG